MMQFLASLETWEYISLTLALIVPAFVLACSWLFVATCLLSYPPESATYGEHRPNRKKDEL
jgi:hypothetical protein